MRKLLLVIFTPFALHAMEMPQEVNNSKDFDFDINRVVQEVAGVLALKYEKIISNFLDQGPLPDSIKCSAIPNHERIIKESSF